MIDGAALAHLREERGWTQHELGLRADISHAQIGRWESGKRGSDPGFGIVCRLAEALDVPPWEFMLDSQKVKSQLKIWPGGRPEVKAS